MPGFPPELDRTALPTTGLPKTGGFRVLPPENRLRQTRDHQVVVRQGVRGAGRMVVVHLISGPPHSLATSPARVGFVVDKSIGGAVVRNALRRRLRHVMRDRLRHLPPGSLVLVRARPEGATASSETLADDLDVALARAWQRARRQSWSVLQRRTEAVPAGGDRPNWGRS